MLEGDEDDDAVDDLDNGNLDTPRTRRRTTSAFNRSNGLVLSSSYITATYGGAPAFYSLWLGEKCTSTVVVHLQVMGASPAAGKSAGVRLSCDRIVFAPINFFEPQIVRVEMTEPCAGTTMILHRVFSLDKNYDRINTPNVVVKTERTSAGALLSLGGALVHRRKNAKGEVMEPRLAANRVIDLERALAAATATMATAVDAHDSGSISLPVCIPTSMLSVFQQQAHQQLEAPSMFVSHLAAGNSFSSAVVKPQGGAETLLVWGMNASGELGIGSTTPMVDPVPLVLTPSQLQGEPFSVMSVSCGKQHAALVTSLGRLFTWGNNKHGQLGLGDFTNTDVPREVVFAAALFRVAHHQRALRIKHAILEHGASNVTQVACGAFHTLFVTHQQHVLSMGYNQAGQLGVGHRLQQHKGWRSCTPAMVESLRDSCILDLAAGQNHSACVLSNGAVFVWGCGGDGRLGVPLGVGGSGDGISKQSQSECEVLPVPVVSLKDLGVKARAVRCGARHTAVISDRDLLYVWGANEFGQLGLGDKKTRTRPCLVQYAPLLRDGVVDVALGEFHSACVTWGGDAFVWGLDLSSDQSTRLDQRCAPELVALPECERAVRVSCGWSHTTVLTQTSAGDTAVNKGGEGRRPVHVHRRKEKAQQSSAREQEVAKWRRVSSALAVMGRLQHRVGVWKKSKSSHKKAKSPTATRPRLSFVQLVAGAMGRSGRFKQEEGRQRKELVAKIVGSFVQHVVDEGVQRVLLTVRPQPTKKKAKTKKKKKKKKAQKDRPARPPTAQGVFYHNALQLLSPPILPPPCLPSTSCSSPRHVVVSGPFSPMGSECHSPTPTPPPSRSRTHRPASAAAASPSLRSLRSPLAFQSPRSLSTTPQREGSHRTLTEDHSASCASLLAALRDEEENGDHEQLRTPTPPTPRGANKHLQAVESLLHKSSFSLVNRLASRPSRPHASPQHR